LPETPATIWAVVPAAGWGQRMGALTAKQYLPLGEHCILEHTLMRLHRHRAVSGVVVAVAADDQHFARLDIASRVRQVVGGAQRADSVLCALEWLISQGCDDDWAMVHDAVRPCIHHDDLDRLIEQSRLTTPDGVRHGAILALPVTDTMKRVENHQIRATVARDNLWRALTPQLFGVRELHDALIAARDKRIQVTDEAQAMELAGFAPAVVQGRADNIKITRPEDLQLAALFLQQMECT
jgi:2-C-methyl-D-erythritol 4-phosphate cytidylyltransferase